MVVLVVVVVVVVVLVVVVAFPHWKRWLSEWVDLRIVSFPIGSVYLLNARISQLLFFYLQKLSLGISWTQNCCFSIWKRRLFGLLDLIIVASLFGNHKNYQKQNKKQQNPEIWIQRPETGGQSWDQRRETISLQKPTKTNKPKGQCPKYQIFVLNIVFDRIAVVVVVVVVVVFSSF